MIQEIKDRIFADYPYKTELHAHTLPISPCSDFTPEALVEAYLNTGVSAIVLANHFTSARIQSGGRAFVDDFISAYHTFRACAEAKGIKAIFGIELRFAENANDYLILGVEPEDAYEISRYAALGLERFRKEYRREGMLVIQAHPKRDGMTDVPLELLDGIESFNMHPGHNSRPAIAARIANRNGMIATGGTDFHHKDHEGCCLLRSKTRLTSSAELSALLRSRDYVLDVSGSIILP